MKYPLIGKFLPGKSCIHQLDARTKLLCLFLILAALVTASSPLNYLLLLGIMLILIYLGQIPLAAAFSSIRRTWLFFLTIFLMNALFFDDGSPIWSWGIFHLSKGGIQQGTHVVVTVIMVMILGNILTCTTAPMALTTAIGYLIKPLKLFRIPTDDIAMIIGTAITFIPTLFEEIETIKKAQTARGARFESKQLKQRISALFPLVIPVFLSAFRRADELAQAMEARGYRKAGKRTSKKAPSLPLQDRAILISCLLMCITQYYVFTYLFI